MKILKQYLRERKCRKTSHTYIENSGVTCPFTGNTYHYCTECGTRRTVRAGANTYHVGQVE
jgi:hypothetical protein